jgi:hypothetical protein
VAAEVLANEYALTEQPVVDRPAEARRTPADRQVRGGKVNRQQLHALTHEPIGSIRAEAWVKLVLLGTKSLGPTRVECQDVARPQLGPGRLEMCDLNQAVR